MPNLYVDLVFGVVYGTAWIVLDRYRARKREIFVLTLLDYHSTRWAERTWLNPYMNSYSYPAFALGVALFLLRVGYYSLLHPLAKPEVEVVRSIIEGWLWTIFIESMVIQLSYFRVESSVISRVLALTFVVIGLWMIPAFMIVFGNIGFTTFHPLGFIVIATMTLGWAILVERQQNAKRKPVG